MGLAAPAVMLASTNVPLDEYRVPDVSRMSWADRLAYKDALGKRIEELNKAQQRLEALIAQEDHDIADIDRQIQELQAQRDALREKADKLLNKLKPDDDGLKWGFDDGILDAPWRTESDDLEDQMADLDQQIEDLQEQKQDLLAQRQDHQDQLQGIDQRLKSVRDEQEKLNGLYEPRYDGTKPAPGMNSVYGKPGQLPLDAPIKSDVNNRSFVRYQDVIDQFAVGNNPRYAADSNTYCNTFAGDVARAMEVPLPQKREFGMHPRDQATIGFPQMWDYFTDPKAPVTAASDGWRQAGDLGTIKNHVNSGKMAVAINNGHIAVLKPGQGDGVNHINDLIVSQAGGINSNNLTLADGFGSTPTPQIYIID
jgi:prefoldin subunit 5